MAGKGTRNMVSGLCCSGSDAIVNVETMLGRAAVSRLSNQTVRCTIFLLWSPSRRVTFEDSLTLN